MAKLRRTKARRLVLDMGTSAIRLCELAQTKAGYQLTKYHQKELIIDPAEDEEAKKDIRNEALKSLLKDAKVRSKKVIFGVPGQSVFTRSRALPPVPEHKVTQIVRYEIQQQIPFSLDQIALDYQLLSRNEAGGYEVLMAAIKVDVVEKHLEILRRVKRTIETVDVSPFAAYNWLKHTGEFGDQGDCVALVDLGASTTDILVESENLFRFTRSLNLGGNDITKVVGSTFGVSFGEAEQLKRERGFAPTGDPQRDGKGGEAIGGVLSRLVTEIARSFAYFRSQPGGGPVSRVIVTGGGSCLRNIIPYLQRQLGVPVRIAQPLAGLAIAPSAQEVNEHPEQAAVVLGLALRCTDTVPIEINLVPPRVLELARRKEQAFYWALSLATLALIMASIIPLSANKDKGVRDQMDNLKKTLQQYDPALVMVGTAPTRTSGFEQELGKTRNVVRDLEGKVSNLDRAFDDRINWLKYVAIINDARPPGAGIVFSTIESTFIGFLDPSAMRGGRGGDDDDDEEGEDDSGQSSARLARLLAGGGGRALPSTGFHGLTAQVTRRERRVIEDDTGQETATSLPPVQPNGLIVYGFAADHETLLEFKTQLEQSGGFIEKGVYFDDSSANLVAASALDNVAVARGGRSGGGRAPSMYEQSFRQFRIDVQFAGESPAEAIAQAQANLAARGASGSGRSRERRRDDDERRRDDD